LLEEHSHEDFIYAIKYSLFDTPILPLGKPVIWRQWNGWGIYKIFCCLCPHYDDFSWFSHMFFDKMGHLEKNIILMPRFLNYWGI